MKTAIQARGLFTIALSGGHTQAFIQKRSPHSTYPGIKSMYFGAMTLRPTRPPDSNQLMARRAG